MCKTNLKEAFKSEHRLICKVHWSDPDKIVPCKHNGSGGGVGSFSLSPLISEFLIWESGGGGWGRRMFSPLVKAFCHQQLLPDIVRLLPICVNPNIVPGAFCDWTSLNWNTDNSLTIELVDTVSEICSQLRKNAVT